MLNQQTIDKLKQMKLGVFADEMIMQTEDKSIQDLPFEERIGLLVDSEFSRRKNNKIKNLLKRATLDIPNACIEDIEYHLDRKLDKSQIEKLSTCNYIREKQNIILLGATGAGKSYLACVFGNKACRSEFKVKYYRLPDLLVEIELSRVQGIYKDFINSLLKFDLLILDEWMLLPLNEIESRNLFELIEKRQRKGAIIFCSQFALSEWHHKIDQDTLAEAIIDRISHSSHEILIEGKDSMRKKKRKIE